MEWWETLNMGSEVGSESRAPVLCQDVLLALRGLRRQIPVLGVPGRGKRRPGGGGKECGARWELRGV